MLFSRPSRARLARLVAVALVAMALLTGALGASTRLAPSAHADGAPRRCGTAWQDISGSETINVFGPDSIRPDLGEVDVWLQWEQTGVGTYPTCVTAVRSAATVTAPSGSAYTAGESDYLCNDNDVGGPCAASGRLAELDYTTTIPAGTAATFYSGPFRVQASNCGPGISGFGYLMIGYWADGGRSFAVLSNTGCPGV